MIRAPAAGGAVPQTTTGHTAAPSRRGAGAAPLTPAQARTLEAIRRFAREHGYTPPIRTLAALLGLRSSSTAQQHVRALVRKGRVRIARGKGIVLVDAVPLADAVQGVLNDATRAGDVYVVGVDAMDALRRAIQ